jgi:guanine nucleotide exchange factor VAV
LDIFREESVRIEVSKCEFEANERKYRLRDLLAVPMQRVLKYHLILRELMSSTSSEHEDYQSIQQAYNSMLDISDYINEVKRDSEQLQIIKDIQNNITEWNMPNGVELKDYGRLRKDGELKLQCHGDGGAIAALAGGLHNNGTLGGGGLGGGGGSGKTKIRYVFAFDKVMLMCKATRGDNYIYKDSLKLSGKEFTNFSQFLTRILLTFYSVRAVKISTSNLTGWLSRKFLLTPERFTYLSKFLRS